VKIDAFIIIGSLCCLLCQCARNDQKEAQRYIVESERQWAESVATGDPSVVERILADDFVGVDPKGRFTTSRK
jgi:ketosteroid isomerase-like protein